MKRIGYRYQRTIARPASVQGIGFITGASVHVRFAPADASTGIVFVRTDLKGSPSIKAHVANVTGTARRTTLGTPPVHVQLVEHVMAALSALRIDNCVVELDASEPPGLDGSSRGFVDALRSAGLTLQTVRREIWSTERPISVADGEASLTFYPDAGNTLRVSYLMQHGSRSPIHPQRFTEQVLPGGFCQELSGCRTFITQEEADQLRKQGIGSRTSVSDLVVFGPKGPVENRLRYANEPARHKALDIIGDLALVGHDLSGHIVGYRSGHSLNIALARKLADEASLTNLKEMKKAA